MSRVGSGGGGGARRPPLTLPPRDRGIWCLRARAPPTAQHLCYGRTRYGPHAPPAALRRADLVFARAHAARRATSVLWANRVLPACAACRLEMGGSVFCARALACCSAVKVSEGTPFLFTGFFSPFIFKCRLLPVSHLQPGTRVGLFTQQTGNVTWVCTCVCVCVCVPGEGG